MPASFRLRDTYPVKPPSPYRRDQRHFASGVIAQLWNRYLGKENTNVSHHPRLSASKALVCATLASWPGRHDKSTRSFLAAKCTCDKTSPRISGDFTTNTTEADEFRLFEATKPTDQQIENEITNWLFPIAVFRAYCSTTTHGTTIFASG